MDEKASLPLARMATIRKPTFWIFIAACMLLYICNKLAKPDTNLLAGYQTTETFILAAAFAGLFLNLIMAAIKNRPVTRVFNIICYGFEIASVVVLAIRVIWF